MLGCFAVTTVEWHVPASCRVGGQLCIVEDDVELLKAVVLREDFRKCVEQTDEASPGLFEELVAHTIW